MAIQINESPLSRQGQSGPEARFDFIYTAWGDAGETVEAMQTAVLAAAPANYTGLPRGTSVSRTTEDGLHWTFVVPYGLRPGIAPSDTTAVTRAVTFGGTTATVLRSKKTVGQYANGLAADEDPDGLATPHFSQAINVQQDGTVNGLEVPIPSLAFTITKEFTFANDSSRRAYEQIVYACCSRVNDDTYLGFAAGELLLLKATAESVDGTLLVYRYTYEFVYSENVTGLTLPGLEDDSSSPHTIDKRGHEYLWTRTKNKTKVVAGKTIDAQTADIAVVDVVFDEADFTTLAL